ncbi:MAG: addiction module protein [Nocardioides sp.]
MSLPLAVRKDVALRLLESVKSDEAFDRVAGEWLHTEAAAAYDALKPDPSRAIPAETVRARFEAKCAARP